MKEKINIANKNHKHTLNNISKVAAAALAGLVAQTELPNEVPYKEPPPSTSSSNIHQSTLTQPPLALRNMDALALHKTNEEIRELILRIGQLQLGELREAPTGYKKMCHLMEEYIQICREKQDIDTKKIKLTPDIFSIMKNVNDNLNHKIKPASDYELYNTVEMWVIDAIQKGAGDCEDYVLAKWRVLVDKGFPPRALLIAIVKDEYDVGHAILIVRTGVGDFVLDNKRNDIRTLNQVKTYGYVFYAIQDPNNLTKWRNIKK